HRPRCAARDLRGCCSAGRRRPGACAQDARRASPHGGERMTSRWYVVQTQPHAESKAVEHLARQGFGAYLPRYLKRRRHARKGEMIGAPLFPRYLFVAVDLETQRWRAIHSTSGVARLVCNGDEPAPVPPNVVLALQQREDAAGFVKLERR